MQTGFVNTRRGQSQNVGAGKHFRSSKAISGETGSENIAESVQMNSQPSTSYSTPTQCMGLSDTVSTLETTSGLGGTGSAEIWCQSTSKTVLDRSTSQCRPITANFHRKRASDSHLRPNRKWKCGFTRRSQTKFTLASSAMGHWGT